MVGSWPEPFAAGSGAGAGGRSGRVLAPAGMRGAADALRGAGARPAIARGGAGAHASAARIVVGPWAQVRSDPAVDGLREAPRERRIRALRGRSGPYHLIALDATVAPARDLGSNAGLGGGTSTWRRTGHLDRHRVDRARGAASRELSRCRGAARPVRRRHAAARTPGGIAARPGGERMRPALSYIPRRSPLDDASAVAATVYLGSFAVLAFAYSNPIVLVGAGAGVVVAGLAARPGSALRASARWGLALGIFVVAVNGLVAQRGDTIARPRALAAAARRSTDVSAEAFVEGGVLALRILVVLMAFAVHSACVDPDRVASPAPPAGPPLGADRDADRAHGAAGGGRLRAPRRGGGAPRSGGRPGRPGDAGAAPGGRVARPRRRRGRDPRASRLRTWRAAKRPGGGVARATTGRFTGRGADDRRGRACGAGRRGWGRSSPIRSVSIDPGWPTLALAASSHLLRGSRSRSQREGVDPDGVTQRSPRDPPEGRAVVERRAAGADRIALATATRRCGPSASGASTSRSSRVSWSCSPAGRDPGRRPCYAPCCGLVPHYHGGDVGGEIRIAGLDARDHGPAELGGAVGMVAQDPETQVVSTTVRGELELPLEMRGEPRRGDRPGGRGGGPGARRSRSCIDRTVDTLSGGELQRVALAAALVGRPTARPARRADLAARSGRGRRADRPAAATERGVGDGGGAGRASARALSDGRRSGAGDGPRAGSPSTESRPPSSTGRSTDGGDPRDSGGPPASPSPGFGRCRSASSGPGRASARRPRASPTAGARGPSRTRRGGPRVGLRRSPPCGSGTCGSSSTPGDGAHDVLRGVELRRRGRRAHRADGAKRRRQDDAPARGGGSLEPVRGRIGATAGALSWPRARATCWSASGWATSFPAGPACGRSPRSGSSGRPTPIRATCPAASASASRWRS